MNDSWQSLIESRAQNKQISAPTHLSILYFFLPFKKTILSFYLEMGFDVFYWPCLFERIGLTSKTPRLNATRNQIQR